MGKLTEEQKQNAREFFRENELAPPYDRELEELATILAPASHVAHTAALAQALHRLRSAGGRLTTGRTRKIVNHKRLKGRRPHGAGC